MKLGFKKQWEDFQMTNGDRKFALRARQKKRYKKKTIQKKLRFPQ
jgi:hypothetical protein